MYIDIIIMLHLHIHSNTSMPHVVGWGWHKTQHSNAADTYAEYIKYYIRLDIPSFTTAQFLAIPCFSQKILDKKKEAK